MRRTLFLDGQRRRVEARPPGDGEGLIVEVEGAEGSLAAQPAPGGWTVTRGRSTREAGVTVSRDGEFVVQIEGHTFRIAARRGARDAASGRGQRSAAGGGGPSLVRTPMPGKVVRVLRQEGDRVAAGDGVLVFEAMKMQNEIRSPANGVIANMKAVVGNPMEGGELLFAVEPAKTP